MHCAAFSGAQGLLSGLSRIFPLRVALAQKAFAGVAHNHLHF